MPKGLLEVPDRTYGSEASFNKASLIKYPTNREKGDLKSQLANQKNSPMVEDLDDSLSQN